MNEREYLGGMPQPTERERYWANNMAKLIVDMIRKRQGGIKDDADELEGQIALELRCSIGNFSAGS
ncbi:MAG TPA: hypothetical protein VH206_09505 [Xanthobacteraceae bacterium]|jgi:hypothetical protein|nr:hypothetical protein [Xanthobacteraceae bacterium]